MRCVVSALSSWVDFAEKRKRVRRLVSRLMIGREGLALRESFAKWREECRSKGWEEVRRNGRVSKRC